ncbi:uncharacterized protein [Miscanthus floridulus]|uniref:uncharacterized protein n=1 Tax=Miscanthus floridulus TaxID=154761 RepID=UPI00345A9DB5
MEAIPLPTTGRTELPTALSGTDRGGRDAAGRGLAVAGGGGGGCDRQGHSRTQPWRRPRQRRDPRHWRPKRRRLTWAGRRGTRPRGPRTVVVVAERTGGESSLALTSGGSESPTRGEPLLRWTNPQEPTLTLFTLDDAAKSMEREILDVRDCVRAGSLGPRQGCPARRHRPTGRSLIARSREKSRFLREQPG